MTDAIHRTLKTAYLTGQYRKSVSAVAFEIFFAGGVDFLPLQLYNNAMAKSEVMKTSPKIGRPPKDVTKSESLQLRITKQTAETLKRCSEQLGISRTAVIERGICKVAEELDGKEK